MDANKDGMIDPSKSNGGIPRGKILGFSGPCECKAKIPTPAEVEKSILTSCEHTTKLVDEVQNKSKKAFTAVELLIVVAIIFMIAAIVLKQKGIL